MDRESGVMRSGGEVLMSRRKGGKKGKGKSQPQAKCPSAGKSCVHFHSKYNGQHRCHVSDRETCVHFHVSGKRKGKGGKSQPKSRRSRSRGGRSSGGSEGSEGHSHGGHGGHGPNCQNTIEGF